MKNKYMRRLLVVTFLYVVLAYFLTPPTYAQGTNRVLVLTIKGAVTPAMQDYFERGIETAELEGEEALVIVLDTPGGQIDITLDIVQDIRRANVPVIVYVAPAGAQAASAGSIITAAAHASGMNPETIIGAASPISGDGSDINETLDRKIREDLKATMRSLLANRGVEAITLGESMIDNAEAITAQEALDAGFIDVVALDLDTLLTELDGTNVEVNGEEVTLQTADAYQRQLPLNTLETILHFLANPNIVAILFAIAVPAILFELRAPGGWVAGFIGVIALGLGLYGAGQLPVNWLGLGLILVAFVLLGMEAHTPSVGALAIAGTITLVAGLLVFFNSPSSPEFARIRISTAIGIALPNAILFLWIGSLIYKAQQLVPITGKEGLIGQVGVVRRPLDLKGTILVAGELWQAKASQTLKPGTEVIVEEMDGFTLLVRPRTPMNE